MKGTVFGSIKPSISKPLDREVGLPNFGGNRSPLPINSPASGKSVALKNYLDEKLSVKLEERSDNDEMKR